MQLSSAALTETDLSVGLAVPSAARFVSVKRVLARLLLPFLGHQAHVNRTVQGDLVALSSSFARLSSLESRTAAVIEATARLEALVELVQDQAFTRLHESIGPLHADLNALEQRFEDSRTAMLRAVEESRGLVDARLAETKQLDAGVQRQVRGVWPRLAQLDLFLDEVRRSLPLPPAPERLAELPSALEGLYPALEDAFRGPPEQIRATLLPYLDDLSGVPFDGPVVDLGCGRGEFLSLLAEAGIDGYGVDLLDSNVERCRAQGLRAERDDAFAHLEKVASGSLRAITGIHLIEHLDLDEQLRLIDRSWAALSPGGILILETPNPENLLVAGWGFYLDPTHQKPIPPPLLEFLLGARGFGGVEVRRLERPGSPIAGLDFGNSGTRSDDSAERIIEVLRACLFAAPDYAVIGKKLQ